MSSAKTQNTNSGENMLNNIVWNNFDEAWKGINLLFLNPDSHSDIVESKSGSRAFSFDNSITIFKPEVSIDIGSQLGYTNKKWTDLIKKYINKEQLIWLRDTLWKRVDKGMDAIVLPYTFTPSFLSTGSCLLGFVIRAFKKHPWSFTFYTRVAEVSRRMAVDYILFTKIIDFIFKGHSEFRTRLVHIELISNVLYQSAVMAPALIKVFDFEEIGLSVTGKEKIGYLGDVERNLSRYIDDVPRKFAQAERIKRIVTGVNKMKSIPVDTLNIF